MSNAPASGPTGNQQPPDTNKIGEIRRDAVWVKMEEISRDKCKNRDELRAQIIGMGSESSEPDVAIALAMLPHLLCFLDAYERDDFQAAQLALNNMDEAGGDRGKVLMEEFEFNLTRRQSICRGKVKALLQQ